MHYTCFSSSFFSTLLFLFVQKNRKNEKLSLITKQSANKNGKFQSNFRRWRRNKNHRKNRKIHRYATAAAVIDLHITHVLPLSLFLPSFSLAIGFPFDSWFHERKREWEDGLMNFQAFSAGQCFVGEKWEAEEVLCFVRRWI